MDIPSRVVITISGDGYRTQVFDGDKEMSNRLMLMVSPNEAKGTDKGDVFDDLNGFEELAEEIDSVDLGIFGVASELAVLKEDY